MLADWAVSVEQVMSKVVKLWPDSYFKSKLDMEYSRLVETGLQLSASERAPLHVGRNGLEHPGVKFPIAWPDLKDDLFLMLDYAKPVGTLRYRFSDDLTLNAEKAIAQLYCERCAADFRAVIDAGVKFYGLSGASQLRSYPAALALFLKKVDSELGPLEGCYTLFNRVALDASKPDAFAKVFKTRLESWLMTVPEHAEEHADQLFPYVKHVLRNWRPVKQLAFKTFLLTRSLWAKAGATDQVTPAGLQHSKAAWAYSLSDDELWAWWLANKDASVRWKVFVKPDEVAAFRLIINSDTVTYLKCAYVSFLCEGSLRDGNMFAFASPERKLQIITNIQDALARGEHGVAFDASNWDGTITHAILRRTISLLVANVHDADAGLANLTAQTLSALIALPDGRELVAVNGLGSGYRWTTLLNSVINEALQWKTAADAGLRWTQVSTLGDDVVAVSPKPFSLQQAAKAYAEAGFKLNVSKSKAGQHEVEFLKQRIVPGRVSGVPLRALRAIMFSSSAEGEESDTVWQQRNALWAKFAARMGGAVSYLFPHMVRDLHGASRMMRPLTKYVHVWLATSAALGGGGWLDETVVVWRPTQVAPVEFSEKQELLVADIVGRQDNKWRMFELNWVKGMRQRAETLITGVEETGSVLAVARIVETLSLSKSKLPLYLVIGEFLSGVAVPQGALHDSVMSVIAGCDNRRDVLAVADALERDMPLVSKRLKYICGRWQWSGARDVLRGRLPTSVSARAAFSLGDMGSELLAPFVANTTMLAAPRSAGSLQLALTAVPVLRLVGTRGWRVMR